MRVKLTQITQRAQDRNEFIYVYWYVNLYAFVLHSCYHIFCRTNSVKANMLLHFW